ncbi:helix-turn-helix domain-containing protein [Brevundimonas diminuta]|uniref:helix-turn-helix domain-containing protein n=1 Tax=Brevundimonas diminuta TaxID=293 RepID=UPI003209697D
MDSLAINVQIGQNVKLARKGAGLDVAQLAALLDISADQIERIEAGTHRATAELLWLMARAMGVSASVFFTEFGQTPKM